MPVRPLAPRARPPRASRAPSPSRGRGPARTYAVYSAQIANAGTAETSAVVEVTGPTPPSWFVANVTQGRTLWVGYAVPAGLVLAIDLATRAATLDGAPVAGVVDLATTRWWSLGPGANTVRASVVATIRHRHAWR